MPPELWDYYVHEEFQGQVFDAVGEVEDYMVDSDFLEFAQFSGAFIG